MVVLSAQITNGCLLPTFSAFLLSCINDPNYMGDNPQGGLANIFLCISVVGTFFLASFVCITKIFHWLEGSWLVVMIWPPVAGAIGSTGLFMLILFWVVDRKLCRRIISSIGSMCKRPSRFS